MNECHICGKIKSSKGKLFTEQTLKQHIKDLHNTTDVTDQFGVTNLIADDDMPDGAYFALAWELGEFRIF